MATFAESGLFPPMIDAYLPAFDISSVISNGLRINYNLSEYNDPDDIKSVHVSITRQNNYQSALNSDSYPMGIYVYNFREYDDKNEVTINFSNLNESQLNYNEYYKVQIRLSTEAAPNDTGETLSTWLSDETNLLHFSEWSTVCLIRFIAPPILTLEVNGVTLPASSLFTSSNLILSGVYTKQTEIVDFPEKHPMRHGNNDKEYLSSYQVQIFNSDVTELLWSSEIIEVNINNNTNIYYEIPYYFENRNYRIKVLFTTANLYEGEVEQPIDINVSSQSWGSQAEISKSFAIDSVIGKVNITFEPFGSETSIPANRKIVIRRASDKDDFTIWDTIWKKTLTTPYIKPTPSQPGEPLSFDDFTIESGTLYRYEVSYFKPDPENPGEYLTYVSLEEHSISVFDNAFLTGEGTQLCVRFNPNVSNYKVNVSDNITTTIGGRTPYISRNGNMYYRSFSLSGTIAYEMDLQHQFATRSSMYGDYIEIYGTYFVNRYINQQNDRITQRKFRELVMNYLYDDVPKLFRSTPEGNILVRITDVNLTPKQELGRMIYDFSCTATEIGDCTIENYKLYQIQDFGD